jgi:hypothetical protein
MTIPERIAYLDKLDDGFRDLTAAGAQLLGVVLNEVPHVRCQYVAVWAMPEGTALSRRLEAVLEDAGWHRFFRRATASTTRVEPLGRGASRHVAANGR